MNARPFKILFILFFLISLSSCDRATYSKEKLEQSVLKLCKDEYNLVDVKAKVIGSTLGVFIPIDGLVDINLGLDQEAGEKIEDVALSIHRVTMSTDSPVKFYTLTARDTKIAGAEFILTGFVYDIIRVRLLDISRGEYHKRILRDFKFNPAVIRGPKIKELFNAVNEDSDLIQEVRPLFYPISTIGKRGSQKIEILEMHSKEISNQEALFHVKTREYYEVLSGLEAYTSIFPPSGFNDEYLILVNVSMLPKPIKEIVTKYFYQDTEIRQRNLKETFSRYKDIGYIGIDGFPKRELKLDWFLSQQIARRIKMAFSEQKRLKERFSVQASHGLVNNKIFQFGFSITSDRASDKDDEIIFSTILKLIVRVFHRYSFEDFEGIEVIDTKPGGKKVYLSKPDLERFKNNRIKIKDIIGS